jgi:hypothetical protein
MAPTKAIASIRSLALTAAAAFFFMSAVSSADTPNPFVGKWALDLLSRQLNFGNAAQPKSKG